MAGPIIVSPTMAGSGKVMGPHMQALARNLETYDSEAFDTTISNWREVHRSFVNQKRYLDESGHAVPDAFHHSSYMGTNGKRAFTTAAVGVGDKNDLLSKANASLDDAKARADKAHSEYHRLLATLPTVGSYQPAPDPNAAAYKTHGLGIGPEQSKANTKALADDKATHASQEQAIAAAEQHAAHHNQRIEEGFNDARPKVQALFHEPNPDPAAHGTESGGSSGSAGSPYATGSRTQVENARARIRELQPEVRYADGYGHDLIQQQHAIIRDAMATNSPEWDANQGMWVNADGSQASATSFASATVDGQTHSLSSLLGGNAGMAGAAIGGGAMVAGIGKMAGGKLAAAFGGATSEKAIAGGKMGQVAASKTNLAGPGGRGTAAGSRGAAGAGKGTGAGSRTGAGGRGGGAGGRGKGKDKKGQGKNGEYIADYTEDWIDPDENIYSDEAYQRAIERKRREQG